VLIEACYHQVAGSPTTYVLMFGEKPKESYEANISNLITLTVTETPPTAIMPTLCKVTRSKFLDAKVGPNLNSGL